MSSLLIVSNANSKSEEFSLKDIEVSVDSEEQNWFQRAHVGKFLGIENIRTSLNDLDKCEMLTRQELVPTRRSMSLCSGLKDQQNKTDKFLSFLGVMYVIVNSKKDKGKALKEHILKDIVPLGFDAKIKEVQGKHQQAIEEKDNQIQALEFTNEVHQRKILKLNEGIDDLIKSSHIPRRGYFDNVLCFIKKNRGEVHPYYVIQCQYRQLQKYKKCFKLRYSNMEEAGWCDVSNAIHRWNIFKSEVIEKPNYYKNHFILTEEKQELLETIRDVTILC